MSARKLVECDCLVDRQRPDTMLKLCPPCAAEFTEKHTRALADYRARYVCAPTTTDKVQS